MWRGANAPPPPLENVFLFFQQLMNSASYLVKNYGDRGGRYPPRPMALTDNTLLDLHNSSQDTEAEFNNCFIIHSK